MENTAIINLAVCRDNHGLVLPIVTEERLFSREH